MRYQITIKELARSSCTTERPDSTLGPLPISKRHRSQRSGEATAPKPTTSDSDELECQTALWLDGSGAATIPEAALRAVIETGARKLKQGPQVREGLIVEQVTAFDYDKKLGKTVNELGKSVQFTVAVVVQRARILRTRAKFDEWAVTFTVEVDDELVDKEQLATWLDIAGRRIGLGDWRPEKSGHYGRFETVSIKAI